MVSFIGIPNTAIGTTGSPTSLRATPRATGAPLICIDVTSVATAELSIGITSTRMRPEIVVLPTPSGRAVAPLRRRSPPDALVVCRHPRGMRRMVMAHRHPVAAKAHRQSAADTEVSSSGTAASRAATIGPLTRTAGHSDRSPITDAVVCRLSLIATTAALIGTAALLIAITATPTFQVFCY
jgi:hypothetical protein